MLREGSLELGRVPAGSDSRKSFGATLHPRWGILGVGAAEGSLGRRQGPRGWKAPAGWAPGPLSVGLPGVQKPLSVAGRDGSHARLPAGRGTPPWAAGPSTPALGPGPGPHAPLLPSSGRWGEGTPCWNRPETATRPLRLQLLGLSVRGTWVGTGWLGSLATSQHGGAERLTEVPVPPLPLLLRVEGLSWGRGQTRGGRLQVTLL